MMPDYSDFPKLFLENLKKEGFNPTLITDEHSKFRYKGNEKIINFFQKNFFRNKDYKKKLIAEHKLKAYFKILDDIKEKLDYVLIIRPDQFPIPVVKELKKKNQ